MFRKSALALVAIFGLAAANNLHNGVPKPTKAPRVPKTKAPRAPKPTKAPKAPHNGGGAGNKQLAKLSGYDLCARYPQYVAPQASQGAATFPVLGGTCPAIPNSVDASNYYPTTQGQPVGVLSQVCGMNPYAGRQVTVTRTSTGGADNLDQVGNGDCPGPNNCDFFPVGYPQFWTSTAFAVPQGATSEQIQEGVNDWCQANIGNYIANTQTTTCYGTLAIRGTPQPKNKYPGSELDLVWNTTTTYAVVGGTYTIDTQYGLAGTEYPSDVLGYASLYGYSVIDSITCQVVPVTITHTPAVVYGGSGKYEKTPGAIVDPVTLTTTRMSDTDPVGNPYNQYQNEALYWQTAVRVNYIKKGGYLDYSLL